MFPKRLKINYSVCLLEYFEKMIEFKGTERVRSAFKLDLVNEIKIFCCTPISYYDQKF